MCDLESASFSSHTILATNDISEEQMGVSPTGSNDEDSVIPVASPLVVGTIVLNENREISSVTSLDNVYNNITCVSLIATGTDDRFVSFSSVSIK